MSPIDNPPPVKSQASGNVPNAAPGKTAPGKVTGKTRISTLQDLKNIAPEVYKQMMIGIAMNICHEAEKGQNRIKQAMRKAREELERH